MILPHCFFQICPWKSHLHCLVWGFSKTLSRLTTKLPKERMREATFKYWRRQGRWCGSMKKQSNAVLWLNSKPQAWCYYHLIHIPTPELYLFNKDWSVYHFLFMFILSFPKHIRKTYSSYINLNYFPFPTSTPFKITIMFSMLLFFSSWDGDSLLSCWIAYWALSSLLFVILSFLSPPTFSEPLNKICFYFNKAVILSVSMIFTF